MKILTSSYGLDLSGVPTFTLAMYNELVNRGHSITVYSPLGGKLETQMNTVCEPQDAEAPDIIVAQNNICAETLRETFPNIPLIFYSHSIWVEMEQPPTFSADKYIAINETVAKNMQYKGVNTKKITIIRDFVDTKRFSPTIPIHNKLKNVLFVSNYKKWNNFKAVSRACEKIGANLHCVGSPYGRSENIEKEINKADLVISWGRGIIEAMACGRAVVSFDKLMGDGYIDEEKYFSARRDNFCGYLSQHDFNSVDALAAELLKYDAKSAEVNRGLATKYHNATHGVDSILAVIHELI
ncbi:hypothetical protein C4564_04545 [Candidatus Microgenomates bacterium]|nr:MAG: hypothetical protein C4564_04545 [Candidatus Microgenomates bacterium]